MLIVNKTIYLNIDIEQSKKHSSTWDANSFMLHAFEICLHVIVLFIHVYVLSH